MFLGREFCMLHSEASHRNISISTLTNIQNRIHQSQTHCSSEIRSLGETALRQSLGRVSDVSKVVVLSFPGSALSTWSAQIKCTRGFGVLFRINIAECGRRFPFYRKSQTVHLEVLPHILFISTVLTCIQAKASLQPFYTSLNCYCKLLFSFHLLLLYLFLFKCCSTN